MSITLALMCVEVLGNPFYPQQKTMLLLGSLFYNCKVTNEQIQQAFARCRYQQQLGKPASKTVLPSSGIDFWPECAIAKPVLLF